MRTALSQHYDKFHRHPFPFMTFARSSVEVEQILPYTEHGPDPRDFYASDSPDSPVLDERTIRNVSIQRFRVMTKSRALLHITYGFLI